MKIINIGILAHVDAGKTTVTENLLFRSGVIKEMGRVDLGNTQTDSMELEKNRGITIKATPISFEWNDFKINLIDTPGHIDFIAEVERSLNILDGAILIISAKEGIQSQTRVLFDVLKEQNIPIIIFVNKIDRVGCDCMKIMYDIKKNLSNKIIKMQNIYNEGNKDVYINKIEYNEFYNEDEVINLLSELDERFMVSYVKNAHITIQKIDEYIKELSKKGKIYPIFFGSALLGKGIEDLLDAITNCLPHYIGEQDGQLSSQIFKIERDSNNIKKIFVKVFQGKLSIRENVSVLNSEVNGKIKKIFVLEKGKLKSNSNINTGDIGVIYGLEKVKIGDILGNTCDKIKCISFAKPTLKTQVYSLDNSEKTKLYSALVDLVEEDPLLDMEIDNFQDELYIRVFGDIQLQILKSILNDNYKVKVGFSEIMTIYKETPLSEGHSIILMRDPFNPFYASIGLKIEPLPRGSGLQFLSQVSLGSLPKPFHNAVEEAIIFTSKQGLLGWEVTDIKVTFTYSYYDSVYSTPADFRNLTPMVFMEALSRSGTGLLEPQYEFELKVPMNLSGKALSDLKKMKAVFYEQIYINDELSIKGLIPVDTCKNYNIQLASYTEGKGFFYTRFKGYKDQITNLHISRKKMYVDPLNKRDYILYKLNAKK